MQEFIREPHGLTTHVNIRPSIAYGSLQQMYCIGINFNYTMSMPIQILPKLAADKPKGFVPYCSDTVCVHS